MYKCLFVECFRCFQTNWGRSDLKKRVTLRNALNGVNTTRWHTSAFVYTTKSEVHSTSHAQHRMLSPLVRACSHLPTLPFSDRLLRPFLDSFSSMVTALLHRLSRGQEQMEARERPSAGLTDRGDATGEGASHQLHRHLGICS